MPSAKEDNRANVICPMFVATGVCALGPRCGMLHVPPGVQPPGGPRHTPHVAPGHACMAGPVGDALHRAQPRATPPPGAAPDVAIAVALPGEATPFERVRLAECLNTRGLKGKRAADSVGGALVLAHCTHYLLKRICHLGAQCRFVHAARPSDAALAAATVDDGTPGIRGTPTDSLSDTSGSTPRQQQHHPHPQQAHQMVPACVAPFAHAIPAVAPAPPMMYHVAHPAVMVVAPPAAAHPVPVMFTAPQPQLQFISASHAYPVGRR